MFARHTGGVGAPSRGFAMTQLAEALRQLMVQLHSTELSSEEDARVAREVTALASGMNGNERLRWYEGGPEQNNYARFALFHGPANPVAIPMTVSDAVVSTGVDGVVGEVTVSRLYEGPPRGVHGGYLSGLFDDILGGAMRVAGGPTGLTGRLTVRYRSVTPLDTPLRFEAWPTDVRSRRIVTKATCSVNGVVTAEAEALFLRVDLRKVADQETTEIR